MSHTTGQLDIVDRELLANEHHKESEWTEIGEAKITYSIFGHARVSIIRKRDKRRRALLLTVFIATAVVAVAWIGWLMFQRTVPSLSIDSVSFTNSDGAGAPVPTQTAVGNPEVTQENNAQPPQAANNAGQIAVKAQAPAVAASRNLSANKSEKPVLPNLLPMPPVAISVAQPHAFQHAASSPSAAVPLNKVETAQPSAGGNFQAEPTRVKN